MAQYKPSQRVKPGAVLQSVRTHRLFPRLRPALKQTPKKWRVSRGYVAPHVLCDGAPFSQRHHRVPQRHGNHAARHEEERHQHQKQVALHLLRPSPDGERPAHSNNQSERVQVQVTHKQQILNHDIHRDHVVKIMAFAGTARPLLPTSCHSCVFTENKLDIELVLLLAFSELSLEGTLSLSVQLSL
ncbi:uncharacterized protein LOC120032183 isoform X1 [Salvelinus namaycush]|uniref:Uncharacterized protein LOC120032183 isoform X1 n=1 Tax=Salvelinus namaycush TaxID=8040 RepID=A0A8U0U044_SALNM|nr:uncharacterized protein LOC120032183 isoform X1 [Salvelinus namaycush]